MSSSITNSQIENETASASGNERQKRNKLGYHRTAVACGHCRRRKIRCIPSADQTESRCQNCIRLKKECHFYPIEGDGTNAKKSRTESRVGSSVSEQIASKNSPSPELKASPSHEPYGTDMVAATAPNTFWENAPGLLASPASSGQAEHQQEQANWSVVSTQDHMQPLYHPQHSQPPSAPASAYWFTNDPAAISYQHQQYSVVNASAPQSHAHELDYNAQEIDEPRHGAARRSLSSVPPYNVEQFPNAYNHFGVAFPEIQRSMTMPAMHNQSGNNASMKTQVSQQLGSEQGQYVYNPSFSAQPTPSQWYSPNSHQAFAPHYLPSQRDQNSNHPDWPG